MSEQLPDGGSPKYDAVASSVFALGQFLNEYDWDVFATLTFKEPRTRSTIRLIRPWLKAITHHKKNHRAFVAEEWHKDGERLHLHALVQCDKEIYRRYAWQWWFNRHGRARVLPYDPERRASWYVAKYVAKEIVDSGRWALYGKWQRFKKVPSKILNVFPGSKLA